MNPRIPSLIALVVTAVAVSPPPTTDACAPAPPRNVVVEIASESAIIIWDAKTKTQHFIRRATFTATAKGEEPVKDFGFLVPTPTQPTLEEADDKAFEELAKVTAPKTETRPKPSGGCGFCIMGSAPPAAGSKVEVLEEKRVAGYDAKVLKATNADALTGWLNERGYEVRPALTRWLKPYVEKGWVVTAFKIARDAGAPAGTAVGSSAVRMSFTTDAPIFPYREPDDMREAKTKRLLRVFFLGDKKMTGTLGDNTQWPGKVVWAGKLIPENGQVLSPLLKIPGYEPGEGTWLTEFEDPSSPRPGESDLTFAPHPDQSRVERPSHLVYTARSDAGGKAGFALLALCIAGVYLIQRSRFAPRRPQA